MTLETLREALLLEFVAFKVFLNSWSPEATPNSGSFRSIHLEHVQHSAILERLAGMFQDMTIHQTC
jgi:hypothetical protein